MNLTLREALAYAERGWAVLPCHGVTPRGGCTCGNPTCPSPAKHPLTTHGLQEATTDAGQIRQWWTRWPRANVALRTGAASGLVVLDIDLPHGFDSLRHFEQEDGPVGRSLVARTGSGGAHLYLAHPGSGLVVPNRAGSVLGPGVDVRADGGYVIAPPSRHTLGGAYRWAANGAPAAMPDWLVATLAPPRQATADRPSQQTVVRGGPGACAWAATALDRETAAVRRAPEGMRNHALNRAAFVLGQIVAGGHLARDHVSTLLGQAGEDVGLQPREIGRTITSGLAAGMRTPRHPPALPTRPIDLRTVELREPADRPAPAIER